MGFFKDVDDSSSEDLMAQLDNLEGEGIADDLQVADSIAALDDIDFNSAGSDDSDLLQAIESVGNDDVVEAAAEPVSETAAAAVPDITADVSNVSVADSDSPASADADKEITVITKGTTIKGGISSDGSLEVHGTISGDVECQGKLSIYGSVNANTIIASEIFVNTPVKLVGDLNSTGCVKINKDTVVVGKIVAVSAVIAGAIKGDIEVLGPVVVDSSAVVLGNITAKTLQLNKDAVIEGICTVGTVPDDVAKKFEE